MKYKISNKLITCDYEDYDLSTNSMKKCGCEAYILAGKKGVCLNHLSFALQSDRKPQVYDLDNKEITIKRFKELVLNSKPEKEEKEDAWRI